MNAAIGQIITTADVGVVMVVAHEPLGRVQCALDSVATQRSGSSIPVVIAAPAAEHSTLRRLRAWGRVREITLIDNPEGRRSAGLNAAVRALDADTIVRLDARSVLPPDYVARCAQRLVDPRIGVVGGVQSPRPAARSARARGTARALRNRWLLGNPAYRDERRSGSTDTVYLGVFRRDVLVGVGGFDERLDANEDFELCTRLRGRGLDVWLEDGVTVDYEARANAWEVLCQYHAFGEAKVAYWRSSGQPFNGRQALALALGAVAVGAVAVSARRPARLVALGAAGAAAVVALDHAADPGERDPLVRAHSAVTSVAVAVGWLSGVVTGAGRSFR